MKTWIKLVSCVAVCVYLNIQISLGLVKTVIFSDRNFWFFLTLVFSSFLLTFSYCWIYDRIWLHLNRNK